MGIEKIGLPAKPAARGSSWVLDASSCQGCQTSFSLFNRKHHCRRCGGLFCGNCANWKVILRGQGDAPVRVCEPCKKLEEAARYQARHRGKPPFKGGIPRGSSVSPDDIILKEVLSEKTQNSLPASVKDLLEGDEDDGSQASEELSPPSKDKAVESQQEESETSPEKLRAEALEQRKVYTALKREGKSAEALQAYKRQKELAREADALELALRKAAISQRRAVAEGGTTHGGGGGVPEEKTLKNEPPVSAKDKRQRSAADKQEQPPQDAANRRRKSTKDDGEDEELLRSLKDLGWNDADLKEKAAKEGPKSDVELLAEISDAVPKRSTSTKKSSKENPTQLEILAHKRQALVFKREGKPAEAKEELKKAKILEKKLEEMALFGDEDSGEEDDDDELAALMKSLDKEAKVDSRRKGKAGRLPIDEADVPLSFNLADDDDDTNVDVTDDDINDPSMIEALSSMGWVEEAAAMQRSRAPETGGLEAFEIAESVTGLSNLQSQILNQKRAALALKREGRTAEAKTKLQEAKVLEQKLEMLMSQPPVSSGSAVAASSRPKRAQSSSSGGAVALGDLLQDREEQVDVDDEDMRDPEMMAALKAMGFEEEVTESPLQDLVKPSPLEKKNLQDEILTIKRSALALRKHGKAEEAREELRHAKALEQRLEKMEKELNAADALPAAMMSWSKGQGGRLPIPLVPARFISDDENEEEESVQVSADDFMDPELVAALKSVGWQEQDTFVKDEDPVEEPAADLKSPPIPFQPYKARKLPQKEQARKLQLQKELLALKRRALAFKREGKTEEAKKELKQSKALENKIEEIENAALSAADERPKESSTSQQSQQSVATPALPTAIGDEYAVDEEVTDADMHDPELLDSLKAFGWKSETEKRDNVQGGSDFARPSATIDKLSSTTPPKIEHKLNFANPPYTKATAKATVDPIWLAIMNSSRRHDQVEDLGSPTKSDEKGKEVDHSFDGEYGEIGSLIDIASPVFDRQSSAKHVATTVGQARPFDLLSGEPLKPHQAHVSNRGDGESNEEVEEEEEEEEEDIFDSGLLAALQSLGMGPPAQNSSSKRLQGVAEDIKGSRSGKTTSENVAESKSRAKPPRSHSVAEVPTPQTASAAVESFPHESGTTGPSGSAKNDRASSVLSASPGIATARNTIEARGASAPAAASAAAPAATSTLQEEIKMHKRKALVLKREGKQSEAREELMRAKLLEKKLGEDSSDSSPENALKTGGVPSSTGPEKSPSQSVVTPALSQANPAVPAVADAAQTKQTHKEQARQEVRQGKDRMKLQQESLAHKRKALGLRREGKTDEADAEFELAKSLEKQMEDLDGGAKAGLSFGFGGVGLAPSDMGLVDSLLDPQLTSALQGLGWSDGDLQGGAAATVGNSSRVSAATPGPSTSSKGNQQAPNSLDSREQLSAAEARSVEQSQAKPRAAGRQTWSGSPRPSVGSQVEQRQKEDRIKQEKVKALELKRAGRNAEALEVLRNAKRLEKQLLS